MSGDEKRVLDALAEWPHDYHMTYRDLERATGIPLSMVYATVTKLRGQGKVEANDGIARSVRLK